MADSSDASLEAEALAFHASGRPGKRERALRPQGAIALLDAMKPGFEYDGEISIDTALDHDLMASLYPFSRLTGPANVLIMPGVYTANIASKLAAQLGGVTMIGPLLDGLAKPAQIVSMAATVSDLVNAAALAAYDAIR